VIIPYLFVLAQLAAPVAARQSAEPLLIQEYLDATPIIILEDFTATEQLVAVPYSLAGFPRLSVHVLRRDGTRPQPPGLVFDMAVVTREDGFFIEGFYGPLYLLDLNRDGAREILYSRGWEHGAIWHVYARTPDQGDWGEALSFGSSAFAGMRGIGAVRVDGEQAQISGYDAAADAVRCWTWQAGAAITDPEIADGNCWEADDESDWSGLDAAQAVSLTAFPPPFQPARP
tara:strand:- start:1472 stop:2161 length:690 start_codon:yes stop_codon:yes gene_type:complete